MGVLDRFRLDGKRALVTGGSRGLGRAMAQALAEAGADLVLVSRDEVSLRDARDELKQTGRRIDVTTGDVGNCDETERLCSKILADFSPIGILVNNVGGRRENAKTEEMPLETWRRLVDLNLTSAFLCTKVIGGAMLPRRKGRILNVSSIAGDIAMRNIT